MGISQPGGGGGIGAAGGLGITLGAGVQSASQGSGLKVYGAWTEVDPSLAENYYLVGVVASYSAANTEGFCLIQYGIGALAAEVPIGLFVGAEEIVANTALAIAQGLPIAVSAGERLSVRVAGTGGGTPSVQTAVLAIPVS